MQEFSIKDYLKLSNKVKIMISNDILLNRVSRTEKLLSNTANKLDDKEIRIWLDNANDFLSKIIFKLKIQESFQKQNLL